MQKGVVMCLQNLNTPSRSQAENGVVGVVMCKMVCNKSVAWSVAQSVTRLDCYKGVLQEFVTKVFVTRVLLDDT